MPYPREAGEHGGTVVPCGFLLPLDFYGLSAHPHQNGFPQRHADNSAKGIYSPPANFPGPVLVLEPINLCAAVEFQSQFAAQVFPDCVQCTVNFSLIIAGKENVVCKSQILHAVKRGREMIKRF